MSSPASASKHVQRKNYDAMHGERKRYARNYDKRKEYDNEITVHIEKHKHHPEDERPEAYWRAGNKSLGWEASDQYLDRPVSELGIPRVIHTELFQRVVLAKCSFSFPDIYVAEMLSRIYRGYSRGLFKTPLRASEARRIWAELQNIPGMDALMVTADNWYNSRLEVMWREPAKWILPQAEQAK